MMFILLYIHHHIPNSKVYITKFQYSNIISGVQISNIILCTNDNKGCCILFVENIFKHNRNKTWCKFSARS